MKKSFFVITAAVACLAAAGFAAIRTNKNAPSSERRQIFVTDFGLHYRETEEWDCSSYDISNTGTIPAEFCGYAGENSPQSYGLGCLTLVKTDENGNTVYRPDGSLDMEVYLTFTQALLNDFGLDIHNEDTKRLSFDTYKPTVTLKGTDVSRSYTPTLVYETDLILYTGRKKIVTDAPVFLNISHQLYINCDALAQALNMTHTLDTNGEGTFEKIAE